MRNCKSRLPSLLLPVLLGFGGITAAPGLSRAHAATYDITTTRSSFGTVSGTVTGIGTSITGFDVTAVAPGAATYVFTSAISGDSGVVESTGFTVADGTPANEIILSDMDADQFFLAVTGDFTSGLTYVGGQDQYSGGRAVGVFVSATVFSAPPLQSPETSDDVSLTLDVAQAVPEPGSLGLLAAGLLSFGAVRTVIRRAVRSSEKGTLWS